MKIFKIALLVEITLLSVPVIAQHKSEISGGVGFPEMIGLKFKYGKIVQVGLSQSIIFNGSAPVGPTALEIDYHFAGKSRFTGQPPWHTMCGLGYFWPQKGGIYSNNGTPLCLYPRMGRNLNISKNAGINFEAGAFIPFFDFGAAAWPVVFISLFFRL